MAKHHIEIVGDKDNIVLQNACMSNEALICQHTMNGGFRIEYKTKKAAFKALSNAFMYIQVNINNDLATRTIFSKKGGLYYGSSSAIIHRTKSMKLSNKRVIRPNKEDIFERVMETKKYIFFMNFKEDKVYESIRMYDRKMKLIDAGVEAFKKFHKLFYTSDYTWVSNKLK
jgi:hypothetical protein